MGVSYKKLWKLIIDKDMTNFGIRRASGVSPTTFTKLKKNETVSLDVLVKLYNILHCENGDIINIVDNISRDSERLI